ncbi:hypothetical protein HMPREF9065_00372 [Aggregatibacter sp. oral taxon 458 str. W10330]|nr:hypothetical protein HMPREF9065_00372 [Aggregatibacter sp. oral taxon 458 str. W10330]
MAFCKRIKNTARLPVIFPHFTLFYAVFSQLKPAKVRSIFKVIFYARTISS